MSKKKNDPANLDAQLKGIDPLPQDFEAPHTSLLHRAATAASATAPKRAFRLKPLQLTSALGATAMVIVAGVFFSTGLSPHIPAGQTTQMQGAASCAIGYENVDGECRDTGVMTDPGTSGSETGQGTTNSTVANPSSGNSALEKPGAQPTLVITIGAEGAPSNSSSSLPKVAAGAGPMADASTGAGAAGGVSETSMVKCAYFWGGGCGWRKTEYVAGDSLSAKTGQANVYKVVRSSDPKAMVADLTSVFGIQGEVGSWVDEWNKQTNYFAGSDPTKENQKQIPSIVAYGDQSNNYWYYYNNDAYAWPECVPVVTINADGTKTDEGYCISEPIKTSKAPGEVRALDFARSMMNKLGYSVVTSPKGAKDNAVILKYSKDDWGTSVYASLIVDQQITTISWYVYWNAMTGQVVSAGGTNAKAESAGSFSTISAKDAFKRVSSWQWQGSFYSDENFNWGNERPYPEYTPVCPIPLDWQVKAGEVVEPVPAATDGTEVKPTDGASTPAVEPGVSPEPARGTDPGTDPVVDPIPCVENPPVQVITATASRTGLLQLWDDSQTMWLVPGYLYFDDYGYIANAISLPDGVIKLPENNFIVY